MGRPPGKVKKDTVAVRLEPDTRIKITELRKQFIRMQGFSGTKTYSNSQIIEQAILQYYDAKITEWKFDYKVCGRCKQPRTR